MWFSYAIFMLNLGNLQKDKKFCKHLPFPVSPLVNKVGRIFCQDADFRQDPHGQDHHPRGRALRHHRECQGQDPGQGGHPSGSAEADLRRQAAGGRQDPLRLQHPKGYVSLQHQIWLWEVVLCCSKSSFATLACSQLSMNECQKVEIHLTGEYYNRIGSISSQSLSLMCRKYW